MAQQDARDPYLGINAHIRAQAQGQLPTGHFFGTVLSVEPLIVRAGGMDLEKDDLLVAQHLLPGWRELLTGLAWPVAAKLPAGKLEGTCKVKVSGTEYSGAVSVTQLEQTLTGTTGASAWCTHTALAPGDNVLLFSDEEGQRYFLTEKLVSP